MTRSTRLHRLARLAQWCGLPYRGLAWRALRAHHDENRAALRAYPWPRTPWRRFLLALAPGGLLLAAIGFAPGLSDRERALGFAAFSAYCGLDAAVRLFALRRSGHESGAHLHRLHSAMFPTVPCPHCGLVPSTGKPPGAA